jgi:hypothetical protein
MQAVLGISLYSCPYLKLAKTLCLFYCLSSVQRNWRRGQNRFCLEARRVGEDEGVGGQGGGMTQTMYAHMNKEKN